MYIILAAVFRRFDLELFETTRKDVDVTRDKIQPMTDASSKGVRVVVK